MLVSGFGSPFPQFLRVTVTVQSSYSGLFSIATERRLRRVLKRIDSEPSLSVRELASEVHLTPAHLQRLFKQRTGVRISEVIVECRLQKAASLLSSSELQIKEVAYAVGYEHHSSFVRAFHRRFAQSPRSFREHTGSERVDSLAVFVRAAAD